MKVVKCEKMFMLDCLLGRDCGDSKRRDLARSIVFKGEMGRKGPSPNTLKLAQAAKQWFHRWKLRAT